MTSPPLTDREYAYFKVTGKGAAEVVSKKLSLEPTNYTNEGDLNPRTQKPNKFMAWRYESGLDDTHPMEEHIQLLLGKLETFENELVSLSEEYDLCIQCVNYSPGSGHGLHLDSDTILRASKLRVSFDMDFYYVSDNGHDLDYQ